MPTFAANTKSPQLIKYGIPIIIVAYLRPILSANTPAGNAPANAPTAKNDPTHDSVMKYNERYTKLHNKLKSKVASYS